MEKTDSVIYLKWVLFLLFYQAFIMCGRELQTVFWAEALSLSLTVLVFSWAALNLFLTWVVLGSVKDVGMQNLGIPSPFLSSVWFLYPLWPWFLQLQLFPFAHLPALPAAIDLRLKAMNMGIHLYNAPFQHSFFRLLIFLLYIHIL